MKTHNFSTFSRFKECAGNPCCQRIIVYYNSLYSVESSRYISEIVVAYLELHLDIYNL